MQGGSADFHDVGMEPWPDVGARLSPSRIAPFPLAAARPVPDAGKGPEPIGPALAAAFALHVALASLLALIPTARLPRTPREDSITVEILTEPPPGGSLAMPPPPETPEAAAPPKASAQDGLQDDSMIQATHFYSSGLLADPRSRRAREALPHLARDERIIQLCNIEALEQVHTADAGRFDPDIVVAYAMAEIRLLDHAMAADGGAFRSRGSWYEIRYRCTLSPDLGRVAAFAFRIGNPIPEREWAGHDLPSGTSSAD